MISESGCRCTCPAHCNLLALIYLTMFGLLYSFLISSYSWLSCFEWPKDFPRYFTLKIQTFCLFSVVSVPIPLSYMTTGLIMDLDILIFDLLERTLALSVHTNVCFRFGFEVLFLQRCRRQQLLFTVRKYIHSFLKEASAFNNNFLSEISKLLTVSLQVNMKFRCLVGGIPVLIIFVVFKRKLRYFHLEPPIRLYLPKKNKSQSNFRTVI